MLPFRTVQVVFFTNTDPVEEKSYIVQKSGILFP
jgi:hypothetical protein